VTFHGSTPPGALVPPGRYGLVVLPPKPSPGVAVTPPALAL
jgi:hypothetical protein